MSPRVQAIAVIVAAVVVAVVIGAWALVIEPQQNRATIGQAEATAKPMPSVAATPAAAPVVVSVLSDSHAYNAGSWFRQTVEKGAVPGVTLGVFASQPGASATALAAKVDEATAKKGVVLVQAGTNDLLSAVPADQTARNVEALVSGVRDRGAKPVLVSVPPSNTHGGDVLALNSALKLWASDAGVRWLDVTTSVMAQDGTWKPGLSDDGVHANSVGVKPMGDAAAAQLPSLVR